MGIDGKYFQLNIRWNFNGFSGLKENFRHRHAAWRCLLFKKEEKMKDILLTPKFYGRLHRFSGPFLVGATEAWQIAKERMVTQHAWK